MSMSMSMSSSNMSMVGGSSYSGGLGLSRGGGARIGLGLGSGAGMGLGLAGGRLGIGAGGLGMGAGAGMGLGGGAGAGLGLGGGAGAGLGLGGGAGAGLGLGGGAGSGLGLGGGLGAGMSMGGGLGAGSGGMLVPSAAGSAQVTKPDMAPLLRQIFSRADEKSMLSGLNDRFSVYMNKVKALQQENATLEAKLAQLTGGADMAPEVSSVTTAEYETQLAEYRVTLETLTLDTIKLEIDLDNIRATANELKAKYDFEQGVKVQLEADIASMKKDIEMASDMRIDLGAKQASLKNELDFVNKSQMEELANLHSKLGSKSTDTSVAMIEVDTDKSFDISSALSKIRMEYEQTVQEHREEADAYYKLKMEEIQTATEKTTEDMTNAKVEIIVAKKEFQTLQLELQSVINAHITLQQNLAEAQAHSSTAVTDYQAQIASLESAIELAKADLQKQTVSYRELLDIKLALDIEISTYRKLLEADDFSISVQSGPESSAFLYSSPPDLSSALADATSSPEPSLSSMASQPGKAQEEGPSAKESSLPDKDAATDTQESGPEESSTHSEADDSES